MTRDMLCKDSFEYETVPFLLRVYDTKMYIHAKTGETRRVNILGNPSGMDRTPWRWVQCYCRVATVRPDYPYTIDKEWPNDARHARVVDPFEVPTKGLLFYGTTEADEEPRDPQEMADAVIEKLKSQYEDMTPESYDGELP